MKLKMFMRIHGISVDHLADESKVCRATIYRLRAGNKPKTAVAGKVCRALTWLVDGMKITPDILDKLIDGRYRTKLDKVIDG